MASTSVRGVKSYVHVRKPSRHPANCRSLQGVLFKVYQISVLILLKKILFSFFSVCLPLFIRHIAAMLLRKTSSKTMQTVTKYLKELSGVRSDNSPNSYK